MLFCNSPILLTFLASLGGFIFDSPPRVSAQTLKYQKTLSQLIANHNHSSGVSSTQTVGNINMLRVVNGTAEDDEGTLEVVYLPYLIQFTCGGGPRNGPGIYDAVASISLAMEHLNTGNGSIISEIEGINETCPLRFTTKSFDTECQQVVAMDHVISLTSREDSSEREHDLFPSAIIGAYYSRISIPTSLVSGLRDVPQISPGSSSSDLDNKEQYKLFGRTIPNDDGTAIPLLAKLKEWGVKHLAVLYMDDSYGNAFMEGLVAAAQQDSFDFSIQTVNVVLNPDESAIKSAVRRLAETQYTFFFGILFEQDINAIMTEAYDQGIAGTGIHNWIMSDSMAGYIDGLQFEAGSKLALAYRGVGIISAIGGMPGMENYDKLGQAMKGLINDEDLSYLESIFPNPADYADGKVVNHTVISRDESFLKTQKVMTQLAFDAVIALGLASCELRAHSDLFSGEELYEAFKSTVFEGTSGLVTIDQATGTRDPNSAVYLLINIVHDQNAKMDNGMIQLKRVDTDIFSSGVWESIAPYSFNDGSSNIPDNLPALVTDQNYTSTGFKAVGLLFCGVVSALSIGFGLWALLNRNRQVLRSSQPFFLYIISAGTMLMGLSLVPRTIDMSMTDQTGANKACMSIPWLLATGFSLTFSALFTKTYRVNQIIKSAAKFKRVRLRKRDVIKPMTALLFMNIVVLTIWTVIDPIQRETIVVAEDPFFRELETYGVCRSDHMGVFLGVLGAINAGCLLVALWQAYQARDISTDLQESSYIFIAMSLFVLVSFVGVPVIIIVEGNSNVSYFITASIIFVICTAVLILLYVPKIIALNEANKKNDSSFGTYSNKASRMSTSSAMSTSSRHESGVRILSSRVLQLELEVQVRQLTDEVEELKKQLVQKETSDQLSKSSTPKCDEAEKQAVENGTNSSN